MPPYIELANMPSAAVIPASRPRVRPEHGNAAGDVRSWAAFLGELVGAGQIRIGTSQPGGHARAPGQLARHPHRRFLRDRFGPSVHASDGPRSLVSHRSLGNGCDRPRPARSSPSWTSGGCSLAGSRFRRGPSRTRFRRPDSIRLAACRSPSWFGAGTEAHRGRREAQQRSRFADGTAELRDAVDVAISPKRRDSSDSALQGCANAVGPTPRTPRWSPASSKRSRSRRYPFASHRNRRGRSQPRLRLLLPSPRGRMADPAKRLGTLSHRHIGDRFGLGIEGLRSGA
jgi:hypothetical protein